MIMFVQTHSDSCTVRENSKSNADGEWSENERASDEQSEDSDESDENTLVLNIISDSDSENSVNTDFSGNEEVLASSNNPLVNVTSRSGRTATRFFRDTDLRRNHWRNATN